MKITSIELENLGQFKSLKLPFIFSESDKVDSHISILIGNNGSGKTSVLKALATSLSWFVARLKTEKGMGTPIPEEVILNGSKSASITIDINTDNHLYRWTISKTRKGRENSQRNNLQQATESAAIFRQKLTDNPNMNLPLIAFYPVERAVLDIPLKIRSKHSFSQIDGYDNSLNQGVDFRRFFEWFREREDIENELKLSQIEQNLHKTDEFELYSDSQLNAVRKAITQFMDDFTDLKVKRKPKLHMSVKKGDTELNVFQLSQGEKSLMALVGDIARRLAIMNPSRENPLEGEGVVLIDEIDMHLHPNWQRKIVSCLKKAFPNCQFILTTHSPLVISDDKDILVYSLENGEAREIVSQYGQDVNSVLLDVMDASIRNVYVTEKITELLNAIQNNQFDISQKLIDELENDLGIENMELTRAKYLLVKMRVLNEKNK